MPSSKKAIVTSVLLYTLYGIALLAILVYYKFPYVDFVDYMLARLDRNVPYEIKVSDIEPLTPPIGISLRDVVVSNPPRNDNSPITLARIDKLVLKPSLTALVFDGPETAFKGTMFGGNVSGWAVNKTNSPSEQIVEASFKSIDLKKIDAAKSSWGLDMTGNASGDISFSCADSKWWNGKGAVALTIQNGSIIGLRRYLIPMNKIDQCAVETDLAINKGIVTIKRALINSAQVKVDISGTAKLAQVPAQSILDLMVTIEISAQGKSESRLPFDRMQVAIKGTPARPSVRMTPNK